MRRISRWSIAAKLLASNTLTLLLFGVLILIVFISFNATETFMTRVVKQDVGRVIENAGTGRDLTRMMAEISNLINGFLERDDLLEETGSAVLSESQALTDRNSGTDLGEAMKAFTGGLRALLDHAALVRNRFKESESLSRDIDTKLDFLKDKIEKTAILLMMRGGDVSGLKALGNEILWFRTKLLRIKILFGGMTHQHLRATQEEDVSQDAREIFSLLDRIEIKFRPLLESEPEVAEYAETIQEGIWEYKTILTAYRKDLATFQDLLGDLHEAQETVSAVMALADARIMKQAGALQERIGNQVAASQKTIVGLAAAIFVVLLVITVSVFKMMRPLNQIIAGLERSYEEVLVVSRQVSAAGQAFANRSSEQAASTEETASSLEEVSSVFRENAENANVADRLERQTNQLIGQGSHTMAELTGLMEELSGLSEQVSGIVKTINEFAFQTNLLALNAAVEAARSGEAGAGFAVVADEVRNLALRSAKAAEASAALIEKTVHRIDAGSELAGTAHQNLSETAANAARVKELVTEIATVSDAHVQKIDWINSAVEEIDKITQRNAADAEELAAASGKMTARAKQMRKDIGNLSVLTGRGGGSKSEKRGE